MHESHYDSCYSVLDENKCRIDTKNSHGDNLNCKWGFIGHHTTPACGPESVVKNDIHEYRYNNCYSVPEQSRCHESTKYIDGTNLGCKWGYIGHHTTPSCGPEDLMSDTVNEYKYSTCFSVPDESKCRIDTKDDNDEDLNCQWGYIGHHTTPACGPEELMSNTINEYKYSTCFDVPVEGACRTDTKGVNGEDLGCKWDFIGNRSIKSCFPEEFKYTTCFSAPNSDKCKRDINGKQCLWGTLSKRSNASCYPFDFTQVSHDEIKKETIIINNKTILNTANIEIHPRHHDEIESVFNLDVGHIINSTVHKVLQPFNGTPEKFMTLHFNSKVPHYKRGDEVFFYLDSISEYVENFDNNLRSTQMVDQAPIVGRDRSTWSPTNNEHPIHIF